MIVGLSELKEGIKKKQLFDFGFTIVKYQKFRTSLIAEKVKFEGTPATITNYINLGVSYIKNKTKHQRVPAAIYEGIDEALRTHVQPLTPLMREERRVYHRDYSKKKNIPPVAKLDIVTNPITAKFEYGIKFPDNSIKLCQSKDYASGYIDALKSLNKLSEYKLVAVEISDI